MHITFEGRDYTYIVLTRSISKDSSTIRISIEGQEYELRPNVKGEWDATDATINDKPGL